MPIPPRGMFVYLLTGSVFLFMFLILEKIIHAIENIVERMEQRHGKSKAVKA